MSAQYKFSPEQVPNNTEEMCALQTRNSTLQSDSLKYQNHGFSQAQNNLEKFKARFWAMFSRAE